GVDTDAGSSPRLLQADKYFKQKIAEFVDREIASERLAAQPDAQARIATLFEIFKKDLKIVSIELAGQDDPQVIFETLNARGEPLLPSDLLRNYLFWRASKEVDGAEVQALYDTYWNHFDNEFWKKDERQGRLTRPRADLLFY